jgi:ABC-type multidrug transport system fused ATPase/permease subunit
MSFYGRVLHQLRPGRGILVALAVTVTVYGLGHAALALAAGLLGRALAQHGASDPAHWAQELLSFCSIGLAGALVKAFSGVSLSFFETLLAGRVGARLREQVSRALLWGGLPDARPRVLATVSVRIREVEAATSAGVISGLRAVAQLVPLGLALIFVSPRLATAGVLILAPFALGVAALRRRWRAASSRSQGLVEELHAGVDELVGGLDLWRTYGAGERVESVIARLGDRATRAQARVDATRAALSGANEVLAALGLLGGVLIGRALELPLGDGTFVAFAAIFFMAYRPLRDLGDARAWSSRGAIALEALDRIGASDEPTPALPEREPSQAFALDELELDAFGAKSRGPRTSFRLAAGEIACVLGPTGSGKTTLLRALLGLEPSSGRLLYGARDLGAAGVGPEERPFAWVPQDAPLITGSILENVTLCGGEPARAQRALEAIGAHDLLARAGDPVGPGGRPLSGGESRLVAIARALASRMPVLLLDEPTEGLDPDAELQVLAALSALAGERSLIVVSHRPSVAAIATQRVLLGAAPGSSALAAE